jgi:hypothetical protein
VDLRFDFDTSTIPIEIRDSADAASKGISESHPVFVPGIT